MEFVIVTGMSGAGKTQAANALEDMGFYCVDNLPFAIIPEFVNFSKTGGGKHNKTALVADIRGGEAFSTLLEVVEELRHQEISVKILFLDAADEVLVRRYKENRRTHPLAENTDSVLSAVKCERDKLAAIREASDFVIDTSHITNSQLKARLSTLFFGSEYNTLKVLCKSFGFKYGTDSEADLVFDVRCLPNPFYVEDLREKTGLEQDVRDYVFSTEESSAFFRKLADFIDCAVPLYAKEGKSQLTISFGCTGGKHRSVTFAKLIGERIKENGYDCVTVHRDIQKR